MKTDLSHHKNNILNKTVLLIILIILFVALLFQTRNYENHNIPLFSINSVDIFHLKYISSEKINNGKKLATELMNFIDYTFSIKTVWFENENN